MILDSGFWMLDTGYWVWWMLDELKDDRGQKTDVRGLMSDVGGQRADDRGQKTDVRGLMSDVGGRRADDRGQRAEDR